MTDQADTFTVPLAGRDIVFRRPIPGQLIMLRRRVMRLQGQMNDAEEDNEKARLGSQLIVDTLDLVESLIASPDDVEFLEQAMLHGLVGHEEVMDVLKMSSEVQQPTTKRPRKTAAKATANRGRTKR